MSQRDGQSIWRDLDALALIHFDETQGAPGISKVIELLELVDAFLLVCLGGIRVRILPN
jgi:hypothetical protein